MQKESPLNRYSIISEKNKREIVLLRGSGCTWKKCTFCDYHLDFSKKTEENIALNNIELKKVTGIYSKLEIINSGSFTELPKESMKQIEEICLAKNITHLYFEAHYSKKEQVKPLKEHFAHLGINVSAKIGIETFDYEYREKILLKGINTKNPEDIALYFDECCLLQGVDNQTKDSMCNDIDIGLKHFNRVCVNIMQDNGMSIKPNSSVINIFKKEVYPLYKDNPRVDILLDNTDFGVGNI